MRVVCTSDLHGELPEDLPDGDVLVIAGDVCPLWDHDRRYQANWLKGDFRQWIYGWDYDKIIFIAGNHDFVLQSTEKAVVKEWFKGHIHYLEDDSFEYGGKTFYGTPWTPTFGNWAFMCPESELDHIFGLIPNGLDMLISHGPPRGHCDYTVVYAKAHVGSTALLDRIEEAKPSYVVCGHIHEAYGSDHVGQTRILNVALNDLDYKPTQAPVVIEL